MTNVLFDIDEYKDIELLNMYKERKAAGIPEAEIMRSIYAKGRDNARTPMQWSEAANAGFTKGTPWLRCNPNYTVINAQEELINQDSVFSYYKQLVALRKHTPVLIDGRYELLLEDDDQIFAYTRENDQEKVLVLCNFSREEAVFADMDRWSNGTVLIANYPDWENNGRLRPYEAVMISTSI